MVTSISISNENKTDLMFVLEPWAEEYVLRPNDTLLLEMSSEIDGLTEICHNSSQIILYAPSRTLCKIFLNGTNVTKSSNSVRTP